MFRRKKDPYDQEEERLYKYLSSLEPGTPEHRQAQQDLQMAIKLRGESRESKRRISKADKGGILKNIVGGGVGLLGIAAVSMFELSGNAYSGERRKFMDGLTGIFAKGMEWFRRS